MNIDQIHQIAIERGYPDLGKHFFFVGVLLKIAKNSGLDDPFQGLQSFHNVPRKEVLRLQNRALDFLKDHKKFGYDVEKILELIYRYNVNPDQEPKGMEEDPIFHIMAGYTVEVGKFSRPSADTRQ